LPSHIPNLYSFLPARYLQIFWMCSLVSASPFAPLDEGCRLYTIRTRSPMTAAPIISVREFMVYPPLAGGKLKIRGIIQQHHPAAITKPDLKLFEVLAKQQIGSGDLLEFFFAVAVTLIGIRMVAFYQSAVAGF